MKTEPRPSRLGRVEAAITFALEGRWAEAEACNRELLECHAADCDTWNRLGRALAAQGRRDEAADAYRAALDLDPKNAIAQRNLAWLWSPPGTPMSGLEESRLTESREDEEAVPETWVERGIAETDLEGYRSPYEEYEEEPGADDEEPLVQPFDEAEIETDEELSAEAVIEGMEREQARRDRWLAEEEEHQESNE